MIVYTKLESPRSAVIEGEIGIIVANLKKVDSGSAETARLTTPFHVGMLLHKFLGEPRPMVYSFFFFFFWPKLPGFSFEFEPCPLG